jgi:hypothetical protein
MLAMKRAVLIALCLCAAFGASAAAPQKTLPSYMTLPKDVFPSNGPDSITQEDDGAAEMPRSRGVCGRAPSPPLATPGKPFE